MKRLTLFILLQASLLLCSTVRAESSYVTIGDGTNSTYFYGYGAGYYSTTQTIYTAEEIGKEGYITALAYNVATASARTTTKLEIYLGLTSKDVFEDAEDGLTADELTLVYSGNPTLGNYTGWMDHIFQTKFSFDGTSNLVVVICRESTVSGSPDCYYSYSVSNGRKNLYRYDFSSQNYSDIENLDGYSTSYDRQNTRLKIESFPTITVNNINYTVTSENDKTVSVAPGTYSGIISIPATVTYNGNSYSVTSVGKDAFSGCTGLTYVVLGNNIKTIGANAFKGCSGLTTVKLPTQLETIGNYAFYDCQNCNFSALSLNEGLTNIGDYAFYNCDKIVSVSMPSTLTHLGNNAFQNCDQLETAILPDALKTVSDYCFERCTNLSTLHLPNNALSIGKSAFYRCSKLTHIDLPSSVTTIGDYALNSTGLSSLFVPSSVTSAGEFAFYSSTLKEVTIDSPILEKDYTRGNYSAMTLCNIFGYYVEKYIIGDTPTRIGNYAFYIYSSENTSLKEVVMGKNIKEVGDYAFSSCKSIEKVYYPDMETLCSINFISYSSNPAYNGAAKVYIAGEEMPEELVIPNTVTSIGSYAFEYAKITSVNIPSSVTSIGDYAFDYCNNLTKVYIDSPSLLGKDYSRSSSLIDKFDRWNSLVTDIIIGDLPSRIGNYAFYGGSSSQLTSVTIGKNVREIGENAFGYNSNITKVEFSSIAALCETTFGNNTANPLTFENANLYVNGELVENVVIPNGVTSISDYAFYNAKSIRSVDIPMSVASIGQYSLYGCSNLDDIYVHWQYPPVITNYGGKYGNLHVPIGMKDNYSTKNYWKSFTIIADQEYKTVSDIQFSEPCYRCEVGEIGQVEFSLYPVDALIKDVSVTSDGSSAIYFDESTRQFVGLEDGVATITVTSRDMDAYSESIKIYVGNVPVEDAISLDRNTLNLRIGYDDVLTVSQITTNGSDKPVTWTSTNTSVATVSNGVVTGVSEGTATITASISGGKSATCTVNVFALKAILADGSLSTYSNDYDEEYDQITYTRNYSNTKWQSLYVPFTMRYEDWKEDYDVAYINSVRQYDNDNDGVIDETIMDVLQITGGELYPNMPYMIRAKSTGSKTITLNNATLYQTEENSVSCSTILSEFTFTGTYSTIDAATMLSNNYYAMGGGGLIKTNGTSSLKPFRWYMGITSRSPIYNADTYSPARISINVIGEDCDGETSLYEIAREEECDEDLIFNLNGQKLDASESLKPGLYIKNGKKIMIK